MESTKPSKFQLIVSLMALLSHAAPGAAWAQSDSVSTTEVMTTEQAFTSLLTTARMGISHPEVQNKEGQVFTKLKSFGKKDKSFFVANGCCGNRDSSSNGTESSVKLFTSVNALQ